MDEKNLFQSSSTAVDSSGPTAVVESPKVSLLTPKAGISFVIPRNKLSGALIPVVRGNGKLDQNEVKKEEDAKQPSRKTKWGADLTQDPVVKRGRALALQTRAEQIAAQLESGNLEIDNSDGTRSPSPPPIYDSNGQRINTREGRKREQLDIERREAIGECLRLNPSYKPPSGFKPVHKEAKLFIPVKDYPGYNFIGLILGPRGNTQKRMEAETGTKIAIRGKGAVKEGKLQSVRRDGKEMDGAFEDLHVHISADTYEKVDAAVALIEPLLTPVDEVRNTHKWKQLRELAEMNGTIWDQKEACSICGEIGHRDWQCPKDNLTTFQANVLCRYCGDGGHPGIDCPFRLTGQGKAMDKEYLSFLEELGSGLGGAVSLTKANLDSKAMAGSSSNAGASNAPLGMLVAEPNSQTEGTFGPQPMLLTASGAQPRPSGWTPPVASSEPTSMAATDSGGGIGGPPSFPHFIPHPGMRGRGGFNFFFPPFFHPGLAPFGGVAFFGGRPPLPGMRGGGFHPLMALGPHGIFRSLRHLNPFSAFPFGPEARPPLTSTGMNNQLPASTIERPPQGGDGQEYRPPPLQASAGGAQISHQLFRAPLQTMNNQLPASPMEIPTQEVDGQDGQEYRPPSLQVPVGTQISSQLFNAPSQPMNNQLPASPMEKPTHTGDRQEHQPPPLQMPVGGAQTSHQLFNSPLPAMNNQPPHSPIARPSQGGDGQDYRPPPLQMPVGGSQASHYFSSVPLPPMNNQPPAVPMGRLPQGGDGQEYRSSSLQVPVGGAQNYQQLFSGPPPVVSPVENQLQDFSPLRPGVSAAVKSHNVPPLPLPSITLSMPAAVPSSIRPSSIPVGLSSSMRSSSIPVGLQPPNLIPPAGSRNTFLIPATQLDGTSATLSTTSMPPPSKPWASTPSLPPHPMYPIQPPPPWPNTSFQQPSQQTSIWQQPVASGKPPLPVENPFLNRPWGDGAPPPPPIPPVRSPAPPPPPLPPLPRAQAPTFTPVLQPSTVITPALKPVPPPFTLRTSSPLNSQGGMLGPPLPGSVLPSMKPPDAAAVSPMRPLLSGSLSSPSFVPSPSRGSTTSSSCISVAGPTSIRPLENLQKTFPGQATPLYQPITFPGQQTPRISPWQPPFAQVSVQPQLQGNVHFGNRALHQQGLMKMSPPALSSSFSASGETLQGLVRPLSHHSDSYNPLAAAPASCVSMPIVQLQADLQTVLPATLDQGAAAASDFPGGAPVTASMIGREGAQLAWTKPEASSMQMNWRWSDKSHTTMHPSSESPRLLAAPESQTQEVDPEYEKLMASVGVT